MKTEELHQKVMELIKDYEVRAIDGHLGSVGTGQVDEIYNRTGQHNLYYQWLACLVRLLKPKQVVELGAAAGISTIMMATEMPEDGKLYSVDIDPQAWRWMSCEYKQVTTLLGDDLDLSIWPEETDLDQTDIWFFDSLHTGEQLASELDLYSPFFKKGTVLVFDDIHLNEGMQRVWDAITWDKLDITDPCHYSGFGVCTV